MTDFAADHSVIGRLERATGGTVYALLSYARELDCDVVLRPRDTD